MSVTNVKDFGAIGNGIADDTQAFLDALDILQNTFGKGTLYCPRGTYKLSQKLVIARDLISIKGDGIDVTVLQFDGDGLELSKWVPAGPAAPVTFASVSDLSLYGNGSDSVDGTGIGIKMDNSNFYFLDKIRIKYFDTGIDATTSVLSKFSDFTIFRCRVGAHFKDGSYVATLLNGHFNACSEAGLIEEQSRVIVAMSDFEAIGTFNATMNRYENGTAIVTGYSTEVRDCHIETSGSAFGIGVNGNAFVENCAVVGCVTGVQERQSNLNGTYKFVNIGFSATGKCFDMPTLTGYQIEDCTSRDSMGNYVPMIGAGDIAPAAGAVKGLNTRVNVGQYISYSSIAGIEINGREVFSGFSFNDTINIGTVAANSSQQLVLNIPASLGNALSIWDDTLLFHIMNYDIPAGLLLSANVKSGTNPTSQMVLNVTNTTSSSINVGSPLFVFKVLQKMN